jgi:hypothetical protein
VALQARAKEYAWWLKFHRCIIRAEIARKGHVSTDDEVWLVRYDIGENMLMTLTGMSLRKRREPGIEKSRELSKGVREWFDSRKSSEHHFKTIKHGTGNPSKSYERSPNRRRV